jgi:hypothetical protein
MFLEQVLVHARLVIEALEMSEADELQKVVVSGAVFHQ